jgi:hypothetical protein
MTNDAVEMLERIRLDRLRNAPTDFSHLKAGADARANSGLPMRIEGWEHRTRDGGYVRTSGKHTRGAAR